MFAFKLNCFPEVWDMRQDWIIQKYNQICWYSKARVMPGGSSKVESMCRLYFKKDISTSLSHIYQANSIFRRIYKLMVTGSRLNVTPVSDHDVAQLAPIHPKLTVKEYKVK